MIQATPTKLRSGDWGAKVHGHVHEGDTIQITTRAGKSWSAVVAKVVWPGDGVAIVATQSSSNGHRHHRRDPDAYVCRVCGHDGDTCADLDCTCRACGGMMR